MEKFNFPTPEQAKSFDQQFEETKDLDGINMIKIKKANPSEKTPVLFAPGWSRTKDAFRDSLKTLHDADRDVLSLDHRRKGGDIDQDSNLDFPEEVQRRANSIKKVIMNEVDQGNEEIEIVAQSMGGMDALVATLMTEAEKPGTVKNLVLVNPAGMIGKDSVLELGKRFMGQMKQNTEIKNDADRPDSAKENVKIAGSEFFKYFKENPIRAAREVTAMTKMEIKDLLVDLKKRGIGISIIQGADDLTFPMDRVQENANTEQLDGFYSVKGGHNELYLNPDKYMALAESALTALQNKQKQGATNV